MTLEELNKAGRLTAEFINDIQLKTASVCKDDTERFLFESIAITAAAMLMWERLDPETKDDVKQYAAEVYENMKVKGSQVVGKV
jgi:hypothetical protein